MLLLPEANLYFNLEELRKISGSRNIALNEKTIVILTREKLNFKSLTEESFYPIGVVGYISDIREGFVTVSLQYRVNLENIFINPDHTIKLSISRRNDIVDLEESEKREKLKDLISEMKKYASGFDWGKAAEIYIDQVESLNMAISMMSPWLKLNNEERYGLLKEDSRAKRAEMNSSKSEGSPMRQRLPSRRNTSRCIVNRRSSGRWNTCRKSLMTCIRKTSPMFRSSRRRSKNPA